MRSPPSEEEGATETMCEELTPTPIPCLPVLLVGVGREFRSEAVPGKGIGVGEGILGFGFISHYPTLI